MRSRLCPTCGCSLVRLGASRDSTTRYRHRSEDLYFCCRGCLARFATDPDRFVRQVEDVVVCPGCLGEKPLAVAVAVLRGVETFYFCGCPHCEEAFERDPEGLAARLANW